MLPMCGMVIVRWPGLGRGVARLARLDAIEEVAVLAALVVIGAGDDLAGAIDLDLRRVDHRVEHLAAAGLQRSAPAVRFDPALGAFEADARIRRSADHRSLVPLLRIEIALAGRDGHRHAVGILVVDLERRGRVVDGVARREIALALDRDRAGVLAVVAPLGQIDHVRAPVGEHAAGKGQVPAEVAVQPGRDVGHPRGLAQPHLVVERSSAAPPTVCMSNRSRPSPPTRMLVFPSGSRTSMCLSLPTTPPRTNSIRRM